MIDVVFWALSFLCCLVLPSLALGVPSVLAASAAIRRHAEWRTRAAIAAGLANGVGSAVLHALVGFVLGVDVGEGSTGVALGVSVAGMVVGFALGGGLTYASVLGWTRPPAPGQAPPVPDRLGAWTLGLAIASLVLGVATSLVGLGFSVSIGMISLALASFAVRPIALVFVALHVAGAIGSGIAWRRGARPLRAGGALALSIVGVVLAALIAAFGPTFFERLVEGAASGLGAVT